MILSIKRRINIFLILLLSFMCSMQISCSSEEEIVPPSESVDTILNRQLKGRTKGKDKRYPTLGVYSVTPCGEGFKVKFYYLGTGAMATGVTRPYAIFDGGTLVDTGNVTHNGNTNWVLNPCQNYTIYIDAGPITGVVSFMVTSDGCGGFFVC